MEHHKALLLSFMIIAKSYQQKTDIESIQSSGPEYYHWAIFLIHLFCHQTNQSPVIAILNNLLHLLFSLVVEMPWCTRCHLMLLIFNIYIYAKLSELIHGNCSIECQYWKLLGDCVVKKHKINCQENRVPVFRWILTQNLENCWYLWQCTSQ